MLKHTLAAGDLERLRPGLLRGGVLRLCLSLGGDDRRLGGERGKRPRGDIGLQAVVHSEMVCCECVSIVLNKHAAIIQKAAELKCSAQQA